MSALGALQRTSARRDCGVSLVEVLVTMLLLGVVSSLVVGAVVQSSRVLTHTMDEDAGLQDAKVILDRLARDVRESRGVICDGPRTIAEFDRADYGAEYCHSRLQLWVDSNSDYLRQDDRELVTWELQARDARYYDVYRTVGVGPTATRRLQASSLIFDFAFVYDDPSVDKQSVDVTLSKPPTLRAQEVRFDLRYDAIAGRGSGDRQAAFSARLRNRG